MEVFTLLTLTLTALLTPPHTAAGHFQQFNPAAGQKDPWTKIKPQDLWTKPTPDPWTRASKDPWTRAAGDPWTRASKDPWTRAAGDPWTRATKDPWMRAAGDPWTRATGDPWTKRTTVAPRANPTTRDPWTPTATPDPWTKLPTVKNYPGFDAISTINVISSVYFNSKDKKKKKGGRQGGAVSGSTARCQRAIRDCSLFDVDAAALDDVYQQAFATLLQKQRLTHQANLKKARDFFINLFNQLILDPDTGLEGADCAGAHAPVFLQNDPTNVIPDVSSVQDVIVPPLRDCVVSEWSAWSAPLAFGVVERSRHIIQEGQCCPDELLQQVNITSYLSQDNSAFENVSNVAENFDNDFLNNEPRDILLVIDTSSSIYVTDFELMKDGIKTMIDLFCGGFGAGQSNNRLAIMQFSNAPVVKHYFSDPQTPEALKAKVDQMVDFGGKTCTGDALITAHDEIFQIARGARVDKPNDTLIITDGHANCGANLLDSARLLEKRSKSIYALGIGIAGDAAARAQVTSLVTNEDPHHIFSLARYVDFKAMIEYIKYRQDGQICTPIISQTTGRK